MSASLPTLTYCGAEIWHPDSVENAVTESTSTSASPVVTIVLTPLEAELVRVLRLVAARCESTTTEPLVVRIAGGWVRDKVLAGKNQNSNVETTAAADIDITVNHTSGVAFATLLHHYIQDEYALESNNESSHSTSVRLTCGGRLGIIAANPAQSKHLETATMHVSGLSLDVCPLRGHETYRTESRIPTVSLGATTAHDDALRRDFTLNALFYNCHSLCVEDWTGRGYDDLQAQRLVTPMNALSTLLDDPLRVLRAVRFAVRYACTLDPPLRTAAQQPALHAALVTKVSRERVGKEVEGMLSGSKAQPFAALALMCDLQLAPSVCWLPTVGVQCASISGTLLGDNVYDDGTQDVSPCYQGAWNEASRMLPLAESVWKAQVTPSPDRVTTPSLRLLALASLLLPFRHLVGTDLVTPSSCAPAKTWRVVTYMVRDSLKFKNTDVASLTTLLTLVDDVVEFMAVYDASRTTEPTWTRLEAGLWVRRARDLWVTVVLLATVQLQSSAPRVDASCIGAEVCTRIVQWDLDQCWTVRPLLDGKALMRTLHVTGPTVGWYMEHQVRWMLQTHPLGTLDECVAHLQSLVPPPNAVPPQRGKRKPND